MTPYSAAAGGSFSSRRARARPACCGSSGSSACLDPLAQLGDLGLLIVPLAQLLLDRLHLLAQEVLALALVDLRLDLGLDLGPEAHHLELAGEDLREAPEPLADVGLLQQLLLLLDRDAQRAGDQVAERRGLVEVGDGELQLLGQVGDLLDDLAEGVLDVAGERLELGRGLDHVGDRLDAGDQVGVLGDVVVDPDPLAALDEDAEGPVGDLHHPRHRAGDPDLVQVVGPGGVVLGILRGDHRQQPIAREHVVDQLDRALLADRERGQGVGEGDRLAQRQHGQRVGKRLRVADRLLGVRDLDDLDLGQLSLGGAARGQRFSAVAVGH